MNRMGITTLVIGGMALFLAIIPGMLLGRETVEVPPTKAGALAEFSIGKVKIGLGTKADDDTHAREFAERRLADAEHRESQLRLFLASSMGLAVIGLVFGPIAWTKERHRVVSGAGMALCTVALLWQYIVAGVVIGVALAILLFILAHFG